MRISRIYIYIICISILAKYPCYAQGRHFIIKRDRYYFKQIDTVYNILFVENDKYYFKNKYCYFLFPTIEMHPINNQDFP